MTVDRGDRIGELFHTAAPLPPAERDAFLREACGTDAALRREVESLLAHHDRPPTFLGDAAIGFLRASWNDAGGTVEGDPAIGRRLGPYRVDERIATGGMGTVYRGSRQDGVLEQTVAIKLLHPWRHAEELAQRFRAEWQTLADLVHPHIAQVLDAGVSGDGTPYLVMEYLDGGAIDDYCDREQVGVERRLELFETVARAVHFAHQNLVVHRDLKPANVLVTTAGQPKLLDFGIAKILAPDGREASAAETATRTLSMTPFYASPEQLRGEAVTTATDVYSLGVLLYELLTGRRPHGNGTAPSTLVERIIAAREPTRPSTAAVTKAPDDGRATPPPTVEALAACRGKTPARLRRRLRGELDNIVMKAMHHEVGRRYPSAEALADDVRRHLRDEPVTARPDTILYRTRKLIARNRLASAATVLALAAVVAGTVATAWQARVASAERDHASIEADSSLQVVEIMRDAFLFSAPRRTPEQLGRVAELLERHVFRIRRQYDEDHHERANLLDALGRVHVDLGLYQEARVLIDEAMAIREREFGSESLETARSHASQGHLAHRSGDLDSAVARFRSALDLQQRLPDGVHTDPARAMNDLAVALRLAGAVGEAEDLHEQALSLRRQVSGEDHLTVAESLNNLAAIHSQRGDHARAFKELQRALRIRRECLGDHHPLIAQSLNNLATTAYDLGDRDDAVEYMRESVALYRSIPGIEPHALARSLSNLAGILRNTRDFDGAHAAAAEALELLRAQAGSDGHPQLAEALQATAEVAHSSGRTEEARRLYAEALEIRRGALPAGHPAIGALLCNYGTLVLKADEPATAEPILAEAVGILRASDPQPVGFLATAECSLATSLARQQRYEEAEPLLLTAFERLEGRDEVQREEIRKRLERFYTVWGKPERARAYAK